MSFYNKILVLSDNQFLLEKFQLIAEEKGIVSINYACSPNNTTLLNKFSSIPITSVDIKRQWHEVANNYNLLFSLHCKQLFPAELVKKIKCINIHPGFNPYNRGWFPQVFSILNGMKAGATIHEIDEHLDHGAIIAQKEIEIEAWDTSLSVYNKVQKLEVELIKENLQNIIEGNYEVKFPTEEGNVNLKKDFNSLCKIDLEKQITMNKAIDYLRAMTHGEYKNAYFIDKITGRKIFVSIDLKPEEV